MDEGPLHNTNVCRGAVQLSILQFMISNGLDVP